MSRELLDSVIVEPKQTAEACVIWLHGLGADGHDFEGIVPELHLPETLAVRFIFPHAPIRPVSLNAGMPMRAWFDIYGLDFGSEQDEVGIRQAEGDIIDLIEQQQAQGIQANKIVLAGFSQGGALALHCGLRYPQSLAGIIGLSTVLPLADRIEAEMNPANRQVPIFLAHGELDPVISPQLGQATREWLTGLGYPVEWHSYAMQHTVSADEVREIGQWLARIL